MNKSCITYQQIYQCQGPDPDVFGKSDSNLDNNIPDPHHYCFCLAYSSWKEVKNPGKNVTCDLTNLGPRETVFLNVEIWRE
jgi:hypothetical protein